MDMKPDMIEHIKKHPMWYGAGYLVLLGVLAWLFQSWPGGFWGWLGIAWGWLRETPNGYESASTTIRNLGLLVAAPFALWFAYWRARVADRQSKTAQRSLLNEQYQKGAEMLGSEVLSVRLGGIYTLARLAREHPEEYHVQIMRLFCAFVRYPTKDSKEKAERVEHLGSETMPQPSDGEIKPIKPRPDIRAIMQAIGTRNKVQIEFEKQAKYVPNLSGADLRNQNFYDLNLSGVQFVDAKLSGAYLAKTILSGANFFEADLSGAKLPGVNFSDASLVGANLSSIKECYRTDFSDAYLNNAILTDANLSGAIFSGAHLEGANLAGATFYKDGILAEGLTQRQIAFAVARPKENPPRLDGLIDPETNKPLAWDDRPIIK